MSKLDKLLSEVKYLKGEVMNDPQTYSETHVSGGGSTGQYGRIGISSRVDTWTTFLIETEAGKEFMVKWPESLSVRKGHHVKIATFRDETIAFSNDKTDTRRYVTHLMPIGWWNDSKAFPTTFSYGLLLLAILPWFINSIAWLGAIGVMIWVPMLIIGGIRKKRIFEKTGENLAKAALNTLKTK